MFEAAVFFKGNINQKSYIGKFYYTKSTTFAKKWVKSKKEILVNGAIDTADHKIVQFQS
jgi:hypothetical protein